MPDDAAEELVAVGESVIHGTGVFATTRIEKGAHIGTYRGLRTMADGTYVLWVEGDDGRYRGIDGESVLRFLNHSSTPNVEFDGPELYALTSIEVGQELLFHYGEEWEGVP